MQTLLRVYPTSVAVIALLTGTFATADAASDTGFMQCFYECKLFPVEAPSFYQEQTTLMIMNGDQPTTEPPHPTTRVAYLAFLNGNERILGWTRVGLTPRASMS